MNQNHKKKSLQTSPKDLEPFDPQDFRIHKYMQIQGVKYQPKSSEKYSLSKPKSELFREFIKNVLFFE